MITRFTLAAAAGLLAGPAMAGGLAEPAAEPVPAPAPDLQLPVSADWSGFYAGGSIGTAEVDAGEDSLDANSFGLHGGYNVDLGTIVVGGEAELSRLMLDADGDPEADVFRLKGRVGYDAGAILPYFTAGYARLDSSDLDLDSEDGVFYGIGADYAVTESVLIGAEFLQHDFDDAGIEASTLGLRASFRF